VTPWSRSVIASSNVLSARIARLAQEPRARPAMSRGRNRHLSRRRITCKSLGFVPV
jgi:hypothetical protein